MNYDFPSKRHWRRSLWNCVGERISVPRRNALVLYLAGANDEDREIACQKGFNRHNLIAIDHDRAVVHKLRSDGVLALHGDAFEHVRQWPADRKIDALVLDLCCGMTDKMLDGICSVISHPAIQGAVIAVNMLRGRDSSGNEDRSALTGSINRNLHAVPSMAAQSKAVLIGKVSSAEYCIRLAHEFGVYDTKHRGELLRHFVRLQYGMAVFNLFAEARGVSCDEYLRRTDFRTEDQFTNRYAMMLTSMRAQTLSYRSVKNQTFDTLVWINKPLQAAAIEAKWQEPEGGALRRQQAAVFAHRTRRLVEAA